MASDVSPASVGTRRRTAFDDNTRGTTMSTPAEGADEVEDELRRTAEDLEQGSERDPEGPNDNTPAGPLPGSNA